MTLHQKEGLEVQSAHHSQSKNNSKSWTDLLLYFGPDNCSPGFWSNVFVLLMDYSVLAITTTINHLHNHFRLCSWLCSGLFMRQ